MDSRERARLDAYITREPDPVTCDECGANLETDDHLESCSQYEADIEDEDDAEPTEEY